MSTSVKVQFDAVTRATLATASTLPGLIIVFFVALHLNTAEDMSHYVRHNVVELGLYILVLSTVIGGVLVLAGLYIRKNNPDSGTFVILATQYVILNYTLWGVFMGPYTTSISLVIMGVIMMGYLVFDSKVVLYMVLSCLLTLVIFEILLHLNVVSYAPMFTKAPIEDGEYIFKWLVLMRILFYIAFFVLVSLCIVFHTRLSSYEDELQHLSTTDSLTGLANRRFFMEKLGLEFQRNLRTHRTLSICMCDADFFKKVNDQYGHFTGDKVLKEIANVMKDEVRSGVDLAGRLGGEEFALLLPETDLNAARIVAQRLLQGIRGLEFEADGIKFGITISIGLVAAGSGDRSMDDLMGQADKNLYRAKSEGRDQLIASSI